MGEKSDLSFLEIKVEFLGLESANRAENQHVPVLLVFFEIPSSQQFNGYCICVCAGTYICVCVCV